MDYNLLTLIADDGMAFTFDLSDQEYVPTVTETIPTPTPVAETVEPASPPYPPPATAEP